MIVGIGTDIASIPRIEAVWKRSGERFAKRILTDAEQKIFEQRKFSVSYLATRFAVKEAAAKALGTGIGQVSFQDMEITSLKSGAPVLTFSGNAATLQKERGINRIHISLSDETEYAQAFVILESV